MFAEWETQQGIILIYPHKFCDFSANIDDVCECYESLISEILKVEPLYLIMHPNDNEAKARMQDFLATLDDMPYPCKILEIPTNDLWARDSIAISIRKKNKQIISQLTNAMLGNKTKTQNLGILDKIMHNEATTQRAYANFGFNGWGLKYPANLDNQINSKLHAMGMFEGMETHGMVLEGGSIDYNGEGLLLTNTQCLLESNRNPHLQKEEIESYLLEALQVDTILWLNHGFLLGDDTDSHIDTLARFITKDTIAYIQCSDLGNPHFSELNAMERELENLAKIHKLNLVALPFCDYAIPKECDILNSQENAKINLPASYVNFLFLNQEVLLMPTYNKPTDLAALQALKKALPSYNVIGINCEALIQQHGSLHCISMQIH